MPDRIPENLQNDRAATAEYVATLSTDLASLARRQGLDTLGYLLDMVRLEAENLLEESRDRRSQSAAG
jgi:hypothetical protein